MTAKPTRQPAPPAGLVDSLQAEVAAEASPLMLFLIAHARLIAFLLVVFILAIGGYWLYSSYEEKARLEDARTLGAVLVLADPAVRVERLEAYIPDAPAGMKREAWYALAAAAAQTGDYVRMYKAWEAIRGFDPTLRGTAGLGMANALALQEKYAEALNVLEAAVPELQGPEAVNVNMRIALLAEVAGEYARAIAACDAILASPEAAADPRMLNLFGQKKAELEETLSASGK